MDLRIATTNRRRARIASEIILSFYSLMEDAQPSQITLAIGTRDSLLGGMSAPALVGNKKYHFSFANPAGLARMALLGRGPYRRKIPLRAIGVFPSWDRLVFAVRKDTGISFIEEIKEKRFPLRVSTRTGGKSHATLFAIEEVLKAYGFGLSDIEKWGGKILRAGSPSSPERTAHIQSGEADAVFDEGVKSWGDLALKSGMTFLPVKEDVLRRMERMGFARATISRDHYPELEGEIMTLDFSGWLFFCPKMLPRGVAHLMARAIDLCHSSIPADSFDRKPMTMEEFCQGGEGGPLAIPLHPGAKRYYRQKGYLQ